MNKEAIIIIFLFLRLISCGWNNVRFWRIKENVLKSSPVNLLEYHDDYYTDIQYHPNIKNNGNM